MISTKHLNSKTRPRGPARRTTNTKHKLYAAWMKTCVTIVGILGTFLGVVVPLLGPPSQWFEKPDTSIHHDDHLSIVNVDGEQFEFRLALTLVNSGHKQDTILRPRVTFTSDKPIVNCSRDIVFRDKQGEVNFPLILPKESAANVTCVMKWKPSAEYYRWASAESEETQETKSAVLGRIALTWPGRDQKPTELPFALLAAETIREMKPSEPLSVYYLDLGGDRPDLGNEGAHNAAPSTLWFGLQDVTYRAASIEMPLASTGMQASPVQESKTHYAVKGEVASGKEIPSPNPNEVIVNIRPCGGTGELVVFRAQFRKRFLGSLPCGVQAVQVEKL